MILIFALLVPALTSAQSFKQCIDSASKYEKLTYYNKALIWAERAYEKQVSEEQLFSSLDILTEVHSDLANHKTNIFYLIQKAALIQKSRDKKFRKQYFETLVLLCRSYIDIKEFFKADSLIGIMDHTASGGIEKTVTGDMRAMIKMEKGQWEDLEYADIDDISLFTRREMYFGEYDRLQKEVESGFKKFRQKNPKQYAEGYVYLFPAILGLMKADKDYDAFDGRYNIDSVFKTADKLFREAYGESDYDYLDFLATMAGKYKDAGRFDAADTLYRKVYEGGRKYFGKNNAFSVDALYGLADLYQETGYLTRAQRAFEEADRLAAEVFPQEASAKAISLIPSLSFNLHFGRYDEARKQYEKILPVVIKETGKLSRAYAIMVYYNSLLAKSNTDFEESARLVKDAIAINEKNGIDCNPCFINLLLSLADTYKDTRDWKNAEEAYTRASKYIEDHQDFFDEEYRLNMDRSLADFYLLCEIHQVKDLKYYPGEFSRWDIPDTYDRNIKFYADKYGEKHPKIAGLKTSKAMYHWIEDRMNYQGADYRAARQFRESLGLSLEYISLYLPYLSEKEKTQFYSTMEDRFNLYYAFGLKELNWRVNASEENMIYYRGQMGPDSVNYIISRKEGKYSFKNSAGKDTTIYTKYLIRDRNVENIFNYRLATKGIIFNSSQYVKRRVLASGDSSLKSLYSKWEKGRSTLSALYTSRSNDSLRLIQIDSLEKSSNQMERELSEKSEAFRNTQEEKKYSWKDIQQKLKYGEAAVEIIRYTYPKFEANDDSVCYAALIITKQTKDGPKVVLMKNGSEMENRYYSYYKNALQHKVDDQESYKVFWEHISLSVIGCNTIYFSPDGIYNLINVLSLRSPSGKYLLEEKDVRILSDLKELMNPVSVLNKNHNGLIIGDPDFNRIYQQTPPGNIDERSVDMNEMLRSGVTPLPGTKDETDHISQLLTGSGWNIVLLQKKQATEENLKSIRDIRVLHLATHGFFLKENDGKGIENPLLRSGLLLSGASQSNNIFSGEDGILTAYEAMSLNLENTEIVILSACETGLGELRSGEGVYGLQRAFRAAGAKSIVMSLWKVNDATTNELMTAFYSEWLKTGNKIEAFRNAQMLIKSKYPDPYYWAPFVLISSE
ncbi:MAG TPA: CHAT domain-containing tetratricopeptide repeat protein [Cytophagaceae bacterium]|nr:CHAT domain-containing tetratricopeptide repeat protein [Cytophagaceae bacterium]